MNGDAYRTKIRELKKNYILHLIVNAIIIIFNLVLSFEIFWLNEILYYLYFSLSIFGILYFIIPIIPLIFLLLKKLTQKNIKIFKIKSFIFCGSVIVTGISFIITLMVNALKMNEFYPECPFNLQNSYINKIYSDYMDNNLEEKQLKNHCINRRCILNKEVLSNSYPYEYICNYDPTTDFEKIINKTNNNNETITQIQCNKIGNFNNYHFGNKEIYKFLEMCNSYEQFYICQRISEPKVYSIPEDFKCPKKNYMTILIFLCMVSVLLNLIISFFPWRIEYIKYKNIIYYLTSNSNNNAQNNNSLNSTQNASKIKKVEQEKSFKKEPTEIIFVYTNTDENMIKQDTSYDEKEINISCQNKKRNSTKEINNNIKINNIINNNMINNNIKINSMNYKNNKDNIKMEQSPNIKILKMNKNQKKKETERNKTKENISDTSSNSSKFSPTSERNILGRSERVP